MSRIADVLGKPRDVPELMPMRPIAHAVKVAMGLPVFAFVRFPIPRQFWPGNGGERWITTYKRIA